MATDGTVSKLTVSVSRPVCRGFPLTGQLVRIGGMRRNYRGRRKPLCNRSSVSCLRGHKQYTVHTPAMMRLAAIQHKSQNSAICMRPPDLPRLRLRIANSMSSNKARMSSLHCEIAKRAPPNCGYAHFFAFSPSCSANHSSSRLEVATNAHDPAHPRALAAQACKLA